MIQEDSVTDDKCHHDIMKWSKGASRSYFKSIDFTTFSICDPNGERNLQLDDLI